MWITLTDKRMKEAPGKGDLRFGRAVRRGVQNHNRGRNETTAMRRDDHRLGIIAESAFVDLVGEDKITTWNVYIDDDDVVLKDVPEIVLNGRCIDVKAIKHPRHHLLVTAGSVHLDWAYVAVYVWAAPRCNVAKWIWGRDVLQFKPRVWQYGHTPSHGVPLWHRDMRPIEELFEILGVEPSYVEPPPPALIRPRPPDMHQWMTKHGGYHKIPWDQWEAANNQYQLDRRQGL